MYDISISSSEQLPLHNKIVTSMETEIKLNFEC